MDRTGMLSAWFNYCEDYVMKVSFFSGRKLVRTEVRNLGVACSTDGMNALIAFMKDKENLGPV